MKVAQDFTDFYRQRQQHQQETSQDLLVLTSDGKGIVMHPEDLRAATAKAAQASGQQTKTRLSPGEKQQRKRMATVASVYSTPRFERTAEAIMGNEREPPKRPAILNKRVWASVRLDAKTVIGNAFEEGSKREPCASYREQRVWSPLGSVAVPR